jgi:hypothetical protein
VGDATHGGSPTGATAGGPRSYEEQASQFPPGGIEATRPRRPDPQRLCGDLVELEGIAVTADQCVTALPVFPVGAYQRTMRRLYVLVGATAGRASEVPERTEDMLAQIAAVHGGKRSPVRRVR